MNKKTIGEVIRKLRQDKGISLRQLADNVDVDISFVNISHIENGKQSTSIENLKSIAKALDCDVDKLLADAEKIDDDVEKIIRRRPSTVPEFLRTARNLTNDEWRDLTEQVKTMKKNKKE